MILALLQLAAAVAEPSEARTAFMREFERSEGAKLGEGKRVLYPRKQLAVLLTGSAHDVSESNPIEVWDPDGLLGKSTFNRFIRMDQKGEDFVLTTGFPKEANRIMMTVKFSSSNGPPRYLAGLGDFPGFGKPKFLGFCLSLQSVDTKKDFEEFVSGGFSE